MLHVDVRARDHGRDGRREESDGEEDHSEVLHAARLCEPRATLEPFLTFPIGASRVFVELRPGTSFGLAILRCKPVIAELEALIARAT